MKVQVLCILLLLGFTRMAAPQAYSAEDQQQKIEQASDHFLMYSMCIASGEIALLRVRLLDIDDVLERMNMGPAQQVDINLAKGIFVLGASTAGCWVGYLLECFFQKQE